MFRNIVCQCRDRITEARPVSFIVKRDLAWSLDSFSWTDVKLSVDDIMVSYPGESLSPVDLTRPVSYDQIKHIALSCGNANNL